MLKRIKAIRQIYWIAAALSLVIGVFAVYLWPQTVLFSYGGNTCLGYPFVGSSLATSKSSDFTVKSSSVIKIESVGIVSRGVCFDAASMPKPGTYAVFVAPVWMPFIGKQVTVHVPSAPVASAEHLKDSIPLSKRLVIALSETDMTFSYKLNANDKSVDCEAREMSVGCDIEKLGLNQGTTYILQLDRYYNSNKIATVLKTRITTLPEIALVSSSIKADEVVYTKPKSMTLDFDKMIQKADIALAKDADKKHIPIQVVVKGKTATLTWDKELERQQTFRIIFTRIEATDGSIFTKLPYIEFKTSGGPKVAGVSIGTYKVPIGAMATLTFDQPIALDQDIGRVITLSGGARIAGRGNSSVTVSFADVPKCSNVTIKIGDDLRSEHGIVGGSAWQFNTRTICQSVFSIGTSFRGRAIQAYSFGNGAKTVVYTGAIHGDERSTRSLMLRWIDALEASPGLIPAEKRVVIIPTINPDGYALGTRTNGRNVDVNRNFNTSDWQKDITTTNGQPFPDGGGVSPLSEPESAALAGYIAGTRPVLVVSYHSIGGMVFANQAGNSVALAKRYVALSGYQYPPGGSSSTFEYSISGTADDYYAEKVGVPSILIELGSHSYHQFDRNQSAMWAMLRET